MRVRDTDDDDDIERQVAAMLRKSSAWDSQRKCLVFSPVWMPLDTASATVPSSHGIYVLGLTAPLDYGHGFSKVIYIGSSRNVRERLTTHRRGAQNKNLELFYQHFRDDITVSHWSFPECDLRVVRSIEGLLIRRFEEMFHLVPVCNLDISVGEFEDYCETVVRSLPADDDAASIGFDSLSQTFGRHAYKTTKKPGGVAIVFSLGGKTHWEPSGRT